MLESDLPGWLAYDPKKGEAEWRGARRGDRPAAEHPPAPSGGGVAVGGTHNSVERGDPTTTGVSTEL